ncbi:hypothetical protein [Singulisphaera acidiphila]|uniref:hypothetical protein n=1 Tax=Singulisphaera acidiphila TaxID=466153 RepID=UPI0012B56051|nr:hypothetical protein [Singulisphaera acidiphila]
MRNEVELGKENSHHLDILSSSEDLGWCEADRHAPSAFVISIKPVAPSCFLGHNQDTSSLGA